MSRTFRFKKKHQVVDTYRYSHFADIRNSQPVVDDFIVARSKAAYYKDGIYTVVSGYLDIDQYTDRFSIFTIVGSYTTRSRHSSHRYPHYTSHWDDQLKGCWRDKANDDYWRNNSKFDRRGKIRKMLARQQVRRYLAN
jgi:hypothetical protein